MSYFESNFPLVSDHVPFLLCSWSDVIPNPWLFAPVFPSPMCIKSLSSPVCVAKVFRRLVVYQSPFSQPCKSRHVKYCLALFFCLLSCHGLCSPPTGNTALLQAVLNLLLSLCNEKSHYHRPTSSALWYEISDREAFITEVKFGVSSSETAVFHNVVAQSQTCK